MAEPNGPFSFTVQTLDENHQPLSQVGGSANISGKTTIPLALQGIWKIATARFSNETPLMGSPSTITVNVSGYDADNALIIGPEPYSSPIPLYSSDTSGATSLSATSITKPGQTATLTYDGKSYVNVVVSAGIAPSQAYGQQDTLVPALRFAEYPVPSGSVASGQGWLGHLIVNADNTISFDERGPIGHVTMAGQVTESAMPEFYSDLVRGPDDALWAVTRTCYPNCTSQDNNTLARVNADGSLSKLSMFRAYAIGPAIVGSDGNFWMKADPGVPEPQAVQRVTPAGVMALFPLTNGDTGMADPILGSDGNVWTVSSTTLTMHLVRVASDGTMTSYALPSPLCCGFQSNLVSGRDGAIYGLLDGADLARMTTAGAFNKIPIGMVGDTSFGGLVIRNALASGPDGNLWISMGLNHGCNPEVMRVTPSGTYTVLELPITCDTMAGPATNISGFVAGPDGNLWYARGSAVGKIVLQ
jgi:hypothetical protein